MYGVVNEPGGTCNFAALPGIRVCGKTGSAQILSEQAQKGHVSRDLRDNAWFEAFAPQEAPEIVVVALFENAEHGPNASWIVRDVMKAYFDKKARRATPISNTHLDLPGLLQPPVGMGILPAIGKQ